MTQQKPSEAYLKPYAEAVQTFGPGFEATLWGSKETQIARFDVMINLAGFDGCTILDAGCGHGDFAARLLERNVDFTHFTGVDAIEPIIMTATQRGLARSSFEVADLVADPSIFKAVAPDFICFSGALNTMTVEQARGLVAAAYEAAAQGVVFNFLSDRFHARWKDQNLGPARRFSTVDWLDWALNQSSRVAFTQEYLDGHDATILIRHDGND